MKTALIIAEYNPFHSGHKYQIDKIRELLGEDTAIIAVMSGNFTQRGEGAFMNKFARAEIAVRCGVNLVLELPFPYSSQCAELFAKAGIHIANSLGVCDYICFGSELGDTAELLKISKNISSKDFLSFFEEKKKDKSSKNLGYPALMEKSYNIFYNTSLPDNFFTSNNILAIEYIKALDSISSNIKPVTIKRSGKGYNELFTPDSSFQSATAIRTSLLSGDTACLDYVPDPSREVILSAFECGVAPYDFNRLSVAILSRFRLDPPMPEGAPFDAEGGLYNRLVTLSYKANDLISLISLASTKKYTTSRIRRAILNSFIGVTSSDVKRMPEYTQVLAMDPLGCKLLKRIKEKKSFSVLTKPSDIEKLSEVGARQKQLSDKADSIFELTCPTPSDGCGNLKCKPYVAK